MEDFEELKTLILHYLRGIWKNRWIAIVVAWPLLLIGVSTVDQLKNRYKAETKVYIDSSSVLRPLLRGLAIESDFDAAVQLMVRKLLSRPNLERAARIMDLDIHVNSPSEMEKLITQIRERVDISAQARTNTYTISYENENRNQAKKMVQTLLDIFVEDTLGKSVNESDTAISFLDKQIAKYDALLKEAEERRELFLRENVGLMPKDGVNYFSQLQAVGLQLEEAKLARSEALNRREKIHTTLAGIDDEQDVPVRITSVYDERIRQQEQKLDDLLLLYTDEHPDVINARMVLESLQDRRNSELAEKEKQVATTSRVGNPVYQQLEIMLATIEGDISSFNARITTLEKKHEDLRELVNIVPKIEGELQRLNRDYDVHKKNYTELVERREQAKISEEVESGTEQVKFRIIEPPFVPLEASFPNRPLFDVAILVLALGVGYGVSLLISLLQPVFYTSSELKSFFDYPILGGVHKYDTDEVLYKRRRNLVFFLTANFFLIVTGAVLIYFHSQNVLILSTMQSLVIAR
jgi:polysaccharide chain length determinant protein (PEP-CTERM system associated)